MKVPHFGRRATVAVLATYAAIFVSTLAFGWVQTWSVLTVQSMGVPFGDLRAITGATVTMDRGLDPMTDNVGDPWHRPANYPRVWMATAHALRLTPETTIAYGLVLFGFFIASLALLAPLVTGPSDAVFLYLCAVSPAAMLAVERGKIDFVVLALVCAVIAVRAPAARIALLTTATLLKIFPVFALAAVTLTSRRARAAGIAGLAIVAGWAYAARSDLRLIGATVPVDSRGAYGLSSLEAAVSHAIGAGRLSWTLALVLAAGAVLAGAWAGSRALSAASRREVLAIPDRVTDGLILATSIYVGSFFAASSYDYRLVFLLPSVPFLNALRRTSPALRWGGVAAIVAILIAMSESPLRLALGHSGTAINDLSKVATLGSLTWACALRLSPVAADRHEPGSYSSEPLQYRA